MPTGKGKGAPGHQAHVPGVLGDPQGLYRGVWLVGSPGGLWLRLGASQAARTVQGSMARHAASLQEPVFPTTTSWPSTAGWGRLCPQTSAHPTLLTLQGRQHFPQLVGGQLVSFFLS